MSIITMVVLVGLVAWVFIAGRNYKGLDEEAAK